MKKVKTNKHSIYISIDLWKRLEKFCKENYNVSCSSVVSFAIESFLNSKE